MVLDLPIRRVRQLTTVIVERLERDFRSKAAMAEWQTKSIAATVVASATVMDKKQVSHLKKVAKQVSEMTLFPGERATTPKGSEIPGGTEFLMKGFAEQGE